MEQEWAGYSFSYSLVQTQTSYYKNSWLIVSRDNLRYFKISCIKKMYNSHKMKEYKKYDRKIKICQENLTSTINHKLF